MAGENNEHSQHKGKPGADAMTSRKHAIGTSTTRRNQARSRLASATRAVFEPMEERQMFTTLTVAGGSNVTLGVTPSGGIQTIIDGDTTNYSAGQYGSLLVDTAGSLPKAAT